MFEIFRANGGGFFWHLKGTNGEKLCHSEVYTTKQAAQNGIEAVKRLAPIAPVYDLIQQSSRATTRWPFLYLPARETTHSNDHVL